MKDGPLLRMAREEDGHPTGPGPGQHREPPPPEAAAPAAWQSSALAAESSRPNTFQALAQEPLLKRPRTVEDALLVAGGNLLCLPFPKKLWRLLNSSRFTSIWWEKDGTSIGLKEKLFQKEILERDGPDKVFETDCTKSFIRQLNLYGFSKLRQDVHTSFCLTNCFTGGVGPGPVRVLSKLQFYSSPLFRKDCPHLLKKRRAGVKAAQRQEEDKAEGLGSPAEADPASGTGASLPLPPQSRASPPLPPSSGRLTSPRTPVRPWLSWLTWPYPWRCPALARAVPRPAAPAYVPSSTAARGPGCRSPCAAAPSSLVFPGMMPLCHPWVPVEAAGPIDPMPSIPPPWPRSPTAWSATVSWDTCHLWLGAQTAPTALPTAARGLPPRAGQ
uniref:HSF-type DNA-binding domain-containing protein n=1 Tax=Canis lupus familiaris TaxID=9615 RepID=A0A8I3PNT6_CANLF